MKEILELLEKPPYLEVLLCIASGKNYASSIARYLGKKQPTVTEQLMELERAGLIRIAKRGKAKCYRVNWRLLLDVFYDVVLGVIKLRKEYLDPRFKVNKKDLKKILPGKLLKSFLKEYLVTFVELGGKRKGFDELIFTFFSAMNHLEEKYWKKLVKKYDVAEEKKLKHIAELMEMEIFCIEYTVLIGILD